MEQPEQAASSPEPIDINSLSSDQKYELLGKEPSAPVEQSEPAAGEQPTAGEGTPTKGADPASPGKPDTEKGGESPKEEPEPKKEGDGPNRWRAKTPQQREVFRLMQDGWEMEDAVAHVYRKSETKPDEAKKPEPDPIAEIDTQLSTTQEEIKTLEKQIEEASEEMDTATALKLQRDLLKKEREVEKLADRKDALAKQKEQEKQQGQLNAFEQKLITYRDQALEEFPQLADKTGEDRKAFDKFIAEKESDPDYAKDFDSPRWPLILAREFAREHKLSAPEPKEEKPKAQEKTVTTAAKPRASAAKVITASDEPAPTFQPTKEGLARDLSRMTSEEKFKLLG